MTEANSGSTNRHLSKEEMDILIDRHFRAEEIGDVDGATCDFTSDVVHELAGSHRADSVEGARVFYEKLFQGLRILSVVTERRLHGADFAVDEALVKAETSSGVPAPFRLLHVFEFSDGLIARESAWRAELTPRRQ